MSQKIVLFFGTNNNWPWEKLKQYQIEEDTVPVKLRGFKYYKVLEGLKRTDRRDHYSDGELAVFSNYKPVLSILREYYRSRGVQIIIKPVLTCPKINEQVIGIFIDPMYLCWAQMLWDCDGTDRSVCEKWLSFDEFKAWAVAQHWAKQKKIYCFSTVYRPYTCSIVSKTKYKRLTDKANNERKNCNEIR